MLKIPNPEQSKYQHQERPLESEFKAIQRRSRFAPAGKKAVPEIRQKYTKYRNTTIQKCNNTEIQQKEKIEINVAK